MTVLAHTKLYDELRKLFDKLFSNYALHHRPMYLLSAPNAEIAALSVNKTLAAIQYL